VSFVDDPKLNFISVLVMVVLLIGSATGAYFFVEAFVGATFFQKGVLALNSEGNLDKAESYVKSAISQNPNDLYFRSLAEISLIRIDNILAQNPDSVSIDKAREDFTTAFNNALQNSQNSTVVNPTNYQNWTVLGRVYESAVKVNIEGAYDSAKSSYEKALSLNPHNPETYLILARLEVIKGDNAKAKEYINKAIAEKSNYAEAVFLLSQIQVAEGNVKDAITSVEATSQLAPNDATVFFQLGLLRYNNKDYSGAVFAFERAVGLVPSYANAKYFLGLSYDRVGKKAEAIKQFEEIQAINPDNQDVASILKNLKAGKSALSNVAPPANTPEKSSTLPVKEKTVKEEAE
jgi:tetratricopeptide (TPR) repeat protein